MHRRYFLWADGLSLVPVDRTSHKIQYTTSYLISFVYQQHWVSEFHGTVVDGLEGHHQNGVFTDVAYNRHFLYSGVSHLYGKLNDAIEGSWVP